MSSVEHYEVLIVGGGKAGKTLAADLARAGHRVALVERGMIGGTCINVGCIPTKTLVKSAKVGRWPIAPAARSRRTWRSTITGSSRPKSSSGGTRSTSDRLIPHTVFIDPELGRIGLTEREARRKGMDVRVAKVPTAVVPRARTLAETHGVLKAVVDARSSRILGFAMLGAEAGEVAAVVQMAMLGGLPFTALRDGILAHPTMAEGLNYLFASPMK